MALSGPRVPLTGRRFDRDRLRRARVDARLTQEQLCDRSGVSLGWIKMLESNNEAHRNSKPTVIVAEALADALGCDLDFICPPESADDDAA